MSFNVFSEKIDCLGHQVSLFSLLGGFDRVRVVEMKGIMAKVLSDIARREIGFSFVSGCAFLCCLFLDLREISHAPSLVFTMFGWVVAHGAGAGGRKYEMPHSESWYLRVVV